MYTCVSAAGSDTRRVPREVLRMKDLALQNGWR